MVDDALGGGEAPSNYVLSRPKNTSESAVLRRLDLAAWRDAMTGMPSVDRVRWDAMDPIGRWLIASRAAVLSMTFMAAVIAGLFAYQAGRVDWLKFTLLCTGLTLAHATNNILNDLSDHLRGVDRDNAFRTRYGTQPVEEGLLSTRDGYRWACLTLVPALTCGAILCWQTGAAILPFFGIGLALVLGYNWPLKHFGLGEPTVVLVWGPLMIGGGYLSLTGEWSWTVAAISLPYAIGPTMVLFGKHTDKIPWDEPRGVRTLPVLIGHKAARYAVISLLVAQYIIVITLVIAGVLHWCSALVALSLPFAAQLVTIYRQASPTERPAHLPEDVWPLWYAAYAFVHCRRFGVLYIVALATQVFFSLN
ncbi:MAG: prenyltransferase [Myxococcota bacterium]|nr:prenyltransferase [Myxococcota bacterium]